MATWNLEKSMLTNNGLIMANEAQIGNDKLTITRAEIGNTYTPTVQLPDLTSIPSPVFSPVIGDKETVMITSTISLVVDNLNTTASFQVCQIGIYATHPRVDNGQEKLYYIAQSDSPAEVIPRGDVTPVKLVYKVHLKHGRSNNLVIEVSDSFIPKASSNTLGGIKIGENLEITIDGTLNALSSSKIITSPTEPVDLQLNDIWFETI